MEHKTLYFFGKDDESNPLNTSCFFTDTEWFQLVCEFCKKCDNYYEAEKYSITIVSGWTGEVLAERNPFGLWEIYK